MNLPRLQPRALWSTLTGTHTYMCKVKNQNLGKEYYHFPKHVLKTLTSQKCWFRVRTAGGTCQGLSSPAMPTNMCWMGNGIYTSHLSPLLVCPALKNTAGSLHKKRENYQLKIQRINLWYYPEKPSIKVVSLMFSACISIIEYIFTTVLAHECQLSFEGTTNFSFVCLHTIWFKIGGVQYNTPP